MFSPTRVTLRVGDRVLVTDTDPVAPHTFTLRTLGYDSGQMSQGQKVTYAFRVRGTFEFVCTNHEASGMTGTVTVTS